MLIKYTLNIDVKPEKGEIRRILNEKHIDEEELIRKSSLKNLEISFPGLTSILERLEK